MHEFERGGKNCSWPPLLPIDMMYIYTLIEFISLCYLLENNIVRRSDRMKSPSRLAVTVAVSAEQEVEFYRVHG